jgi:hypothetical protein
MAADFFVVPTATCRLLLVLVILAERLRVVHVTVTDHPTAAWTAQQLREVVNVRMPRDMLTGMRATIYGVSLTPAGAVAQPEQRQVHSESRDA